MFFHQRNNMMAQNIKSPNLLIIAGSDSGGGAGIQADLRVCNTLGVHGSTVITAVTAQNPFGVRAIQAISPEIVVAQIHAIAEAFDIQYVKLGMLFNAEIISAIVDILQEKSWRLIVDPVMIATSGARLLEDSAIDILVNRLLPLATVITPNLMEAEALCQYPLHSAVEVVDAAQELSQRYHATIVLKGGHREGQMVCDVVADGKNVWLLQAPRLEAKGTHGTGCTLSAAIGAFLAKGEPMLEAIRNGVAYVRGAILSGTQLGDHAWGLGIPRELDKDIEVILYDRNR